MKLVYGVKDKPKFGQVIVFAIQQLLAILAATIAVPAIVGNGMSQSAALFGAGVAPSFICSLPSSEAPCSWAPPSHSWAPWRQLSQAVCPLPQATSA